MLVWKERFGNAIHLLKTYHLLLVANIETIIWHSVGYDFLWYFSGALTLNRILEFDSAWDVSIWFGETCDFRISLTHIQSLGKLTNFIYKFLLKSLYICFAESLVLHLQYVVCAKVMLRNTLILLSLLVRKRWKYDNIPARNSNHS